MSIIQVRAVLPCRLGAFYLVFFQLLVFGTSPLGREEGAGLAGLPLCQLRRFELDFLPSVRGVETLGVVWERLWSRHL